MRPLTAVLCAGRGQYVLDGAPRMRERPIIDLVEGLQQVAYSEKMSQLYLDVTTTTAADATTINIMKVLPGSVIVTLYATIFYCLYSWA